jgi:tryptophan halogenase
MEPTGFIGSGSRAGGTGQAVSSIAAALASAGRFAAPADRRDDVLSDLDYALRFDPALYRAGLTALARHLGVDFRNGAPVALRHRDDGAISRVETDQGAAVSADLFVDATGPTRLLFRVLDPGSWQDWSRYLAVDRLLYSRRLAAAALSPLDEFIAVPEGWIAISPGRDGSRIILGHDANTPPERAAAALGRATGAAPGSLVALRTGRVLEPFVHNCLAIGDAAAAFEPLAWSNLNLVAHSLELLTELLPSRDIEPTERAEYNRRWGLAADGMRDFVASHYAAGSELDSPFWEKSAGMERSTELHRTLAEFARRSRLPHREEQLVPDDLWFEVLSGIGLKSARSALEMSRAQGDWRARALAREKAFSQVVAQAQPYEAWLAKRLMAGD